jgi:hypothetical protein
MATTNGLLSQSPHFDVASSSLQPSAKRKRAESNEPLEHTNGIRDPKIVKSSVHLSPGSQQLVTDYIEILKRYVNDR